MRQFSTPIESDISTVRKHEIVESARANNPWVCSNFVPNGICIRLIAILSES